MSLHSTDSYIIDGLLAAESLPDPTTVSGRTHRLHNASPGTQTYSSVGATPFSIGGVLSATLVIPQGQAVEVYSNGTRWIAAAGPARQFAAGTAVSAAAGIATIVFPVPFPVAPVVQGQVLTAAGSNAPFYLNLTAVSTTGATFEVRTSAAVSVALIGLTILLGSTAAVGTTIQWIATTPGATP